MYTDEAVRINFQFLKGFLLLSDVHLVIVYHKQMK